MAGLAARAQEVGADASARVGTMLGEVGSRVSESAASGLEAVRGASARFTLLASGMLAGVAAAIRDALTRRDELRARGLAHAAGFSWRRTGEIFLEGYRQFA